MTEKMQGVIHSIELNENTYSNVTINPTLINFFFGKNGVGKSTIAHKIESKNLLGIPLNNYEVLVYNSEFIHRNIQESDKLVGVFSLGEENIETQQLIEQKNIELQNLRKDYTAQKNLCVERNVELENLTPKLAELCWKITESIRRDFKKTIKSNLTKKILKDKLLISKTSKEHDIEELATLYNAAFNSDDTIFQKLSTVDLLNIQNMSGFDTISKVITSSSDTPFAEFIRLIGSTDWIKQGHQKFTEVAKNQCPYCKQELPIDYENQLASCFDEQYEVDLNALQQFQKLYLQTTESLLLTLNENATNPFPSINFTEYNNKLIVLNSTLELNKKTLSDKIASPSIAIKLENVDEIINELNQMIDTMNQAIETHNTIIQSKKDKQKECTAYVWEYMAFLTQDTITEHKSNADEIEKELAQIKEKKSTSEKKGFAINEEISVLTNQIKNVDSAMHSINKKLSDSGFQGFQLRKDKVDDTKYVILRNDGSLAQGLSEGERNFIAFLYFYHKVMGIETSDSTLKDKIIVIDDPVSSMDSSSLFIVSSIVREMMVICFNNGSPAKATAKRFVRQMFILTHNATFHKQLSYDKVKHYECINFYLITKSNNASTIRLCTKKDPLSNTPALEQNYTPVYNSYTALWKEYNELNSTSALMRVIRQILTYYFIQISGYEGDTLSQRILSREDMFVSKNPDGSENRDLFLIAKAMIEYISSETQIFDDDEIYVEYHYDPESLKNTFHQVFVAMEQIQHYEMMIQV